MKMSKILSLFLILTLMFFIVACTEKTTPEQDENEVSPSDDAASDDSNVDDLEEDLDAAEDDLGLENFDEMDQELNELDDLDY